MNRRHVLLATRASLSDGAVRTLLEIMLHLSSGGETPSLTDLTRFRGRHRSVIQSHIEELINCGVLLADKFVDPKEGYGKRLKVSEDGLAKVNGFDSFEDVDFSKLLEVKSGSVKKSEPDLLPFAVKAQKIETPAQLLKFFRAKHQEYLNSEYPGEPNDIKAMTAFLKYFGRKEAAQAVETFFKYRQQYRCSRTPTAMYGVREKLKGKL